MQTFLTHAKNFYDTAHILDDNRLGKQRVECLQILNTIAKGDDARGWKHHPAVNMWRGYENALVEYGVAICNVWLDRGYADTCLDKISAFYTGRFTVHPPWIHRVELQITHRGRLYFKSPEHYPQFKEDFHEHHIFVCHQRCNYWWPTHQSV